MAVSNVVFDEAVPRNAGVGIQKALENVVTLMNIPCGWKSRGRDVDGSSYVI
jgi:hypothetical protein